MRMNRISWVICALLMMCGLVLAQDAATKPVQVDLSGPKATLKTFVDGIKQGDLSAAKKACQASDDTDKKVLNAGVAWESALERLIALVDQKFGDGAATTLREKLKEQHLPADFVPALQTAIDSAQFDAAGDSTSLALGQDQPELKLTKESQGWKIDVSSTLGNMQPQEKAQMAAQMRSQVKKLNMLRKSVETGKIDSADALMGKFQQ